MISCALYILYGNELIVLDDVYDPNQSKAEKCSNALHVAARRGCTKFVVLALDRGFAKLLEYSNEEDQLPVHVALQYKKYGTAAVMPPIDR